MTPNDAELTNTPPPERQGNTIMKHRMPKWMGTAIGNSLGIVVAAFLVVIIGWMAASSIDDKRNARLLMQYNEDAVVASLPLANGMRPTPIAVVREEDGARTLAITIMDARHHRDDLLPDSLGQGEVNTFAPPSPMRDAFVRDLVQRVSVRLDCKTGEMKPIRYEVAKNLSEKPTFVGPKLETAAGLPTKLDQPRTQVICSLPVTRG